MKQEEKELLLKDLCCRLPYGVKGVITYDKSNTTFTVEGIDNNILHLSDAEECYVEDFKPYLRPMESMTKEEFEEFNNLLETSFYLFTDIKLLSLAQLEWLNKNHFDYMRLIDDDLAIDKTKEK